MTNEPSASPEKEQLAGSGDAIGRSMRPADFVSLSPRAVIRSRKNRTATLAVGTAIIGMILFVAALASIYLFVK